MSPAYRYAASFRRMRAEFVECWAANAASKPNSRDLIQHVAAGISVKGLPL